MATIVQPEAARADNDREIARFFAEDHDGESHSKREVGRVERIHGAGVARLSEVQKEAGRPDKLTAMINGPSNMTEGDFRDPAVKEEMLALAAKSIKSVDTLALRNAFALFDADGDGKLTEEEVYNALTRVTGQKTELSSEKATGVWQRWLAEFDKDNDGKVSVEELATDLDGQRWMAEYKQNGFARP